MNGFETEGRVLKKAALIYDFVQPLVTFGQENNLNHSMAYYLPDRDKLKILDVGCGTGRMTAAFSRRNVHSRVIGIDASEEMINMARRKRGGEGCEFQRALGEDLPFGDGFFDVVCSALFFHHINRDLKKRTLDEIYRVLKPGGFLLVADMGIPYTLPGRLTSFLAWKIYRQPEIRENSEGLLTELIKASHLRNYRELNRFSGYITMFRADKI